MRTIEIKSGLMDTRELGRIVSVEIQISFNASSKQIINLTIEEASDLFNKLHNFLLDVE